MIDLRAEPLFAEVLARPDDVEPRLVLADRLIEAGDPRGEFIEVQCARDRAEDRAQITRLEAREREILVAHEDAWIAPFVAHLREYPPRAIFRRGFVEHAFTDTARFLDRFEEIFDHTPLRVLDVLDLYVAGNIGKLAASPTLRRLRGLRVADQAIDLAMLSPLLASPHLASIRELNVAGLALQDDGVGAIARASNLAQLEALDLSSLQIGRAAYEALAHATFARSLRSLTARWNSSLRAGDLDPIARAPFVALRTLRLGGYAIDEATLVRLILGAESLRSLETLDLYGARCGDATARALLETERLPSLRKIRGLAWPDLHHVSRDLEEALRARFERVD